MAGKIDPVPVDVRVLMLDPSSNLPIVVLHDAVADRYLPIWIGLFEAQAIAMKLEDVQAPRPMTHDLFYDALTLLDVSVEKVVISDLRESTFHAQIHLDREGERRILDARPSDAIALALRANASLLVHPSVMEKALSGKRFEKMSTEEQIKEWLEEAGPEDFGKYEM